ncbi:hypothetical protein KC330_g71 [Hortaea werneckii]|nr:hypothetical protein KC330_g71 [Hortaea werneckii]
MAPEGSGPPHGPLATRPLEKQLGVVITLLSPDRPQTPDPGWRSARLHMGDPTWLVNFDMVNVTQLGHQRACDFILLTSFPAVADLAA